jgi:hypothetical protein
MSTTYEGWVAAGKPCLRRGCGHCYGDHIPSEGMECDACDCPWFLGFHPDDAAAWSSAEGATHRQKHHQLQYNSNALQLLQQVHNTVTRWVQDICDSRGVEYPA